MGRPRKNENEARDVRFTFRMTATQAETFKRQASEMGMSPSALARAAAMGMKQIYITGELLDEMKELSHNCALIGNLLRLHATLLETVNLKALPTESDVREFGRLKAMLKDTQELNRTVYRKITDLKATLHRLNSDHGYL